MIAALYNSLGAHIGNVEIDVEHDDTRVILIDGAAFEFAYRERLTGLTRFTEVKHLVFHKAAREN